MSLILPSSTASAPPGKPSSNTANRHNEQEQNKPVSFGEVLSRSLVPAGESAQKTSGKPVTPAATRRQAEDRKVDPQDLVNAMTLALALVSQESKAVPGAPSSAALTAAPSIGTALAAAGHTTASAAAAAPLTERLMNVLAPADGETAAQTVKAATADTSAQTALAPALALAGPKNGGQTTQPARLNAPSGTASAVGGTTTDPGETAAAPLTELVVNAPAPANGATAAKDVKAATADTGAQTALAPALALASPKDGGQTTQPARLNAASSSSIMALVPGKISAQASAPDTGTSVQSSPGDAKAANKPDAMNAENAGLTPVVSQSASKVSVTVTTAARSAEAAALTITGSPAPVADTFSPSAALPINPAVAAAPVPIGMSAPNTPAAMTTASLAPEVGSSEWGKALGQQVSNMGHAGHQVAELQLNPPGLGPLKVTLSMNDNQIQAMFVSAHASVRAAVEAALPQLRATLADNGISLGNTSVSAGSQQQAAFAQSQNGSPDQRSYRNNRLPADTASLAPRMVMEPLRQNNGITVDTYA